MGERHWVGPSKHIEMMDESYGYRPQNDAWKTVFGPKKTCLKIPGDLCEAIAALQPSRPKQLFHRKDAEATWWSEAVTRVVRDFMSAETMTKAEPHHDHDDHGFREKRDSWWAKALSDGSYP